MISSRRKSLLLWKFVCWIEELVGEDEMPEVEVRMSAPAAGGNFAAAIDRMSHIGSCHFGVRVEGVPFEQLTRRAERTNYDELAVIEFAPRSRTHVASCHVTSRGA